MRDPTTVLTHRGLSPHQFTPMSGVPRSLQPTAAGPSVFGGWGRFASPSVRRSLALRRLWLREIVRRQDHTIMKTTTSLLTILAAVFLAGCSTPSSHRDVSGMAKTHIVVTVTCSNPDTKFTGTIVSDGHSVQLAGTGHGTFRATGHELVCSFKKDGSDGGISISVSEAGNNLGSSNIATKFGGVRAEVVRKPTDLHETFSAF